MSSRQLYSFVVSFFFFIGAIVIAVAVFTTPGPNSSPFQQDLSTEELSESMLTKMLPEMDVMVHVVKSTDIAKKCSNADALACAQPVVRPCEVWVPVSDVKFWPALAYAASPTFDYMVVHEFLHCVYPNWHQPFTDMMIRRKMSNVR